MSKHFYKYYLCPKCGEYLEPEFNVFVCVNCCYAHERTKEHELKDGLLLTAPKAAGADHRLSMRHILIFVIVLTAMVLPLWPLNGLIFWACVAYGIGPQRLRRLWWERA